MSPFLSRSGAAKNFLKTFDMNTFFELMTHHGKRVDTIVSAAFLLMVGYIFASVFLNGGILFALNHSRNEDEKRGLLPLFFEGGGKFLGRFFRLFVYSFILWVGIFAAILIFHKIMTLTTLNSTNEPLIFYLILARGAVALFLVFLVKMIVDYARIKIVTENSRHVFRSLFQAVGFVFRKLGTTLAVYYFFVLTAAVIFFLYWLVHSAFKAHALLPILVAFLIGQAFIFSRGWIRVGLQAAQLHYFQDFQPPQKMDDSGSLPQDENQDEPAP